MNACIQAKLDFSIFILQFYFFNKSAPSESYDLSENVQFAQASAFSPGHPEA